VLDLRGLFILPAALGFVNAARTAAFWAKNASARNEQAPRTRVFSMSSMNTKDWKFEYMVLYSA